jgi:hypothetical protein
VKAGRLFVAAAALALAACGKAGISVPQSPLLRYVERKSGTIVVAGVDGNLSMMDQAGGNWRALTSDGLALPQDGTSASAPFVYYQNPLWSPDGTRVATLRVSGTGQSVSEARIDVVPVKSGAAVTVYSSATAAPAVVAWSPDSTLLVYLAPSASGSSQGFYLVRATGGAPVLLDAGLPYGWAWSPRSGELLVHAGSAVGGLASDRLAFLDVEGDVLEEGLVLTAGMFDTPAWSPDGRTVLVAIWQEGKNRLYLTNRKRTEAATLAEVEGALAFAFSPKGDRVAYVDGSSTPSGPGSRLFVTAVPTRLVPATASAAPAASAAPKLLSGTDVVAAFSWSPDGSRIVYFVPGLVEIPADPSSSGADAAPQRAVVFTMKVVDSKGGGAREVGTFLPSPGFLAAIQGWTQEGQAVGIWSPDSRQIVYASIDQQGPAVMVAMAGEAIAFRRIASGLFASWSRR